MHFFLAVYFCVAFILLASNGTAMSESINIDDLLIPEVKTSTSNIGKLNNTLFDKDNQEIDIDEILGPPDNFPFLPDNHRDAGTGKFNSY